MTNIKKYTAYIIAGAVGVVFIIFWQGASAAPTAESVPPIDNTIATFGGLTVSGGAKIQETLYVADTFQSKTANISGDLTVTGATNLAGDTYAIGNLNVQNGASVQGMLEVADITSSGDIDMSGDLQVSKTVEAGGELRAKSGITNPAETKYGGVAVGLPVEITDPQGLKMTKGPLNIKYDELNSSGTPQSAMIINGLVSIKGGILTNRCDGSANMADPTKPSYCMTIGYGDGTPGELAVLWPVTTDVDFRKNIKNTKGDVTVNDSLKVTGDINTASIQVSGKAVFLGDTTEIKNAYITGSLQNSAATGDYIKVDDALDVRQGIFNNDKTKLIKFGSGSSPMDLSVTGKSTLSGSVDIKGEISNSNLGSPVNIKDDLNVTGNIKTSGTGKIGKYTIRSSGPHSVSSGSILTKEKACNSGETVISCGYKGDSISSGDYDFGLELNNLLIGTSSCKVSVKNTIANKLDLSVYTMCFDPTSN